MAQTRLFVVRMGAILVVALLVAAAILPARGLMVVLPGGGAFPRVPVSIVDGSGMVVGVSVGPIDGSMMGIVALPGRPNAIGYGWLGGRCDVSVSIRVAPTGLGDGSLQVFRQTQETGPACLLDGIARSIVLEFREPIDPTRVIDYTNILF